MKWICGFLAVVAVLTVASCSGEKKGRDSGRQHRVDVPESTDSVTTTADMLLAEVHGPVAQVVCTATEGVWAADSVDCSGNRPFISYTWDFDNGGNIVSISAVEYEDMENMYSRAVVTQRDADGRPSKINIDYYYDEGNVLFNKLDTVDWTNGMPGKRYNSDEYSSESHENEYDEDGNLKRHELLLRDGMQGYKQIDNYKYTKFDEQGNWIERYVRSLGMTIYFNEEGNPVGYGDSQTTFSVDRRVISYNY